MSIILAQGTLPKGTEIKTFGETISPGIHLGPLTISMLDWCACVMYVMTNTDLEPDDPRLKLLEQIKALGARPGWMVGRERLGTFSSVDDRVSAEPDMARMGDKHIKPCRGLNCSELILWAKHVKKDGSIGNVAPLVKAKEGEKPNIAAWYDEKADQWFYEINGIRNPEFVNHHSNCNSKGQFKIAPVSEDEARQAEIK